MSQKMFYFIFQEPVIKGLAILKYCAASVNKEFGLQSEVAYNIQKAAEEVGTSWDTSGLSSRKLNLNDIKVT